MTARRQIVFALIAVFTCMGASARTQNFVVHASTQQVADMVGQWAEHYRKEKAILWLGKEMPPWPQPCPLYVQVNMSGPSGATSFNFGQDNYGNGMVMGQRMEIQGPLDRLIKSVLPHEITHTVFAYHFRRPVPRWADEGGSVLSEDDIERVRHDKLTRSILNSSQQIQMRTLFGLTDYPQGKVMHLYAQGYSITNYLVDRSNRQQFLNFIGHGMTYGWDQAAWTFFKHRSVEELETAWLQHLRETKGQPHLEVAQNKNQPKNPPGDNKATVVRLTVPPFQSAQNEPIIRAQSGEEDNGPGPLPTPKKTAPYYGQPNSGKQFVPASHVGQGYPSAPVGQPKYLPDYEAAPNPGWQSPQTAQTPGQIPVQLGPPQFGPMEPGTVPLMPGQISPVGYPQ